jgi:prefoldin beta subunit
MVEITEETKNMIAEFQTSQQQLQSVLIQKESLKLQMFDIERALEELGKTKQSNAYKITGQLMVSKPVEEIKNELNQVKEDIDVRVKSLERTEERLNKKLKDLQIKLKEVIK